MLAQPPLLAGESPAAGRLSMQGPQELSNIPTCPDVLMRACTRGPKHAVYGVL